MRQIVLAVATAAALFSPTLVEGRGGGGGGGHSAGHGVAVGQTAGGHSTGHSFAVGQTAGGHSARHRFAVGETAGGHSVPPKAWTAAPALVEVAAPAPRSVSSSYCTTCVRGSNGRIARSEAAKKEFM